jgi:hypothetical protein
VSEFYVGYLPQAPKRLGRTILRIVAALLCLMAAVSLLLVFGQQPFADSRFEYGHYRDYEGVIVEEPYPTLLTGKGRFLLVAPGKHGAGDWVRGLDLRVVQLKGSLIHRGEDRMLEIDPGSIRATGGQAEAERAADLGPVTLAGEIVDSKCYFGVMNPGSGKVHRDCAVRCISGGIPPALIVKDSSGDLRTLLLTGPSGRQLNREVLDFVAEPVQISGRLLQSGDRLILEAEPAAIRRAARE